MSYLDKIGANLDPETGIHYGTCYINDLPFSEYALEDVYEGKPLRYTETMDEIVEDVKEEIKDLLTSLHEKYSFLHSHGETLIQTIAEDAADDMMCSISDTLEIQDEIYLLEDAHYKITIDTSDNGVWVLKSPYYSFCNKCSPCAPNAGYIGQEGSIKTYVFGHEYFEDEKAPYPVYSVATGNLIEP
jgi:hypothetical protein